jgi:hypothetical protein
VLLWLGAAALLGDQTIWRPGKVSTRHAIFGDDCAQCHEPWKRVADASCLQCHDGPGHSGRSTFEPGCAGCHQEHRGAQMLVPSISDAYCTQCHRSLEVNDGKATQFASGISSFSAGHPEFAPVRAAPVDGADLRFNHLLHLRGNLKGPKGPVTHSCTSCHAPDLSRMRMTTPSYERVCAQCHPLEFDASRFPETLAPHAEPELVRGFLRDRYTSYIAEHPQELRPDTGGGARRRPGVGAGGAAVETATLEAWVERNVRDAEAWLHGEERCGRCHTLRAAEPGLPEGVKASRPPKLTPTGIKAVWMPHATFDHETHRVLTCTVCHTKAPTSERTADVLLPGVATCRSCHHDGAGSSRSSCVVCHVYHDRSRQRDLDGRMKIPDLTNKKAP